MKLFPLLFLLSLTSISFSQTNEFAPVGAKWWYEYSHFSAEGYKMLESIGDTVIDGKTCRIIAQSYAVIDLSNPDSFLDTFYLDKRYIYSDSGVVYYYALDAFYTLYDFNSGIGETWEVAGILWGGICDSTGQVKVDDTSTITLNTFELKQIFISSVADDYWNFGNKAIIDRIGSLSYLFPSPHNCLFDFYEGGPLRCYYDHDFGYYNVDTTTTCDFVVNISNERSEFNINIGPNPFTEKITISIPTINFNTLLTVYDLSGIIVLQQPLIQTISTINTINFSKGIYIVNVTSETLHENYKIIKL